MSIFTQELLGLFKLGKRKTTYKPSQDYIEVGRLYNSSTLNTGSSYAPRMEPYMIKLSDITGSSSQVILGGDGITVTNSGNVSTVNIDYLGVDNFINIAPVGDRALKGDLFVFHNSSNSNVYKDTFSNMPGFYEGWDIQDSAGAFQTMVSGGLLKLVGNDGINTAMNGPGVIDISLLDSGVVAGSYTSADITVNSKGLVTAVSNGGLLASFSIDAAGALLNTNNITNLTGLTVTPLATGVYQVNFNSLGNTNYLVNAYVELPYNNTALTPFIVSKLVGGYMVTILDTTGNAQAAIVNITMYF
tara:strand:- start:2016 stop:2921 length:906 start_codon:yes stop_codon:yes gene_type:complete